MSEDPNAMSEDPNAMSVDPTAMSVDPTAAMSVDPTTDERSLTLLDCVTFNNLVLTNTHGLHKPSRRWTWNSSDEKHHNQIDYILVMKCF